jgi:hypothetical protein
MELIQTSYSGLTTDDLVNHVLMQGGPRAGFTELETELAQRLLLVLITEGADGADA